MSNISTVLEELNAAALTLKRKPCEVYRLQQTCENAARLLMQRDFDARAYFDQATAAIEARDKWKLQAQHETDTAQAAIEEIKRLTERLAVYAAPTAPNRSHLTAEQQCHGRKDSTTR